MAEDVKVAVLEQKLEDLKDIIVKIDDAIEKLSEVNANVTKMLVVHEEKINNGEKNNIFSGLLSGYQMLNKNIYYKSYALIDEMIS